jgi:hypothetical protein
MTKSETPKPTSAEIKKILDDKKKQLQTNQVVKK